MMEKYLFYIKLNIPLIKSSLAMQAHQLDPTKHYLRLKFLIESQVQFYIPKPEEDVCDLVGKECKKKKKKVLLLLFSRGRKCNMMTLDTPLASFDFAKKKKRASS